MEGEADNGVPRRKVEQSAYEQVRHLGDDFSKAERLPRVQLCLFLPCLEDVSVGDKLGLRLGNDTG
jgi:hypothetical protein